MNSMPTQLRTSMADVKTWMGNRTWGTLIMSCIAIAIALSVASYWLSAPARPPKAERAIQPKLVEVVSVHYGQSTPLIQLHGVVIAARSVTLYPQVDGRIIGINGDLAPGTLVESGQLLASIEQAEYLIATKQAEADLADAKANYDQELGDQAVANRELKLLMNQTKVDISPQQRKLILREPQLAQAQARIDSALAGLEQTKLNLSRTQISSPFAGIISEKFVDLGSQVNSSIQIVDLVDTTTFWIKVSLPNNYLNHLSFANENPGTGSKVKIHLANQAKTTRVAEVYRTLPELDSITRQAQILLRVDDPLALKDENRGQPQLMVNDFVAVDIAGKTLPSVVVLDESWIHNGNQVWTNNEGELRIHTLEVAWREQGRIIASAGLEEGDELITTNIANAYNGLKISTQSTWETADHDTKEQPVVTNETGLSDET